MQQLFEHFFCSVKTTKHLHLLPFKLSEPICFLPQFFVEVQTHNLCPLGGRLNISFNKINAKYIFYSIEPFFSIMKT